MAAHTASGQPLHTNPPCCTMPATRKFTRLLSMESPVSGLATRPSVFTPPDWLFLWDNDFNFTLFFSQRLSLPGGSPWGPPTPRRPGTGQSLLNGRK